MGRITKDDRCLIVGLKLRTVLLGNVITQ